jgi:hypothetical protein
MEKTNIAKILRMNSESARIFAFLSRFGKPSSDREQHMTCLDSSDQFSLEMASL